LTSIVTSSGTTGGPKCIEYSVWSRLHSGRVYIDRLDMTPDDKVAYFVPLYTGPSDLSYHTAPQLGSAQLLLESFSPEAACALIQAEKPTGVTLVPTMLHRILGFSGFDPKDFESLRFVTCGGGVLPFEIGRRVEEQFGVKIIQAYGLMDCGAVTSHALNDSQEARLRAQGRPLDGTEVRVLDADGNVLPSGEVGQVCVRGPHSNGGYMGEAAITEEGWGEDGFFRTGDLGHIDGDGHIILQGRSKDIIIRGGQNISAKEVEDVLAHHPSIKEAVAVKMPDPELGERVCAFAVTTPGASLTLEDIVQFMKSYDIAGFKIPERLELVDEMPLTPGGNKVDKKRLEEMVR
ncbi:MAG: fatty acid--CoA ligase family protein, partial [Rhodospirillales bacterium]|nr:fatty acid--CoA ligase family protein [Rhodospirillales bacterium]